MKDSYSSGTPSATSSNATPSPESASAPLPASPAVMAFDLAHATDSLEPFLTDSAMDKQHVNEWGLPVLWPHDMLGNQDEVNAWNFGGAMDVDSTMAEFVNPSALQYPIQPDTTQYHTATPQELLGLAPLFDAIAKVPQQPAAPAIPLTPAATPPTEHMTPEELLAQMVRDVTGIHSAVIAGAINAQLTPRPVVVTAPQAPPMATTQLSVNGPGGARPGHARSREQQQQPSPTSSASGSPPPPSKPARSKTSHTTIERRYRTNLNARILALRAAVPATAVLDADSGVRADARGYVDGVKAARKGSKATILGKAVEYITVLKKRENRLRRDTAGLRALIGSLVGGQELLRAWEETWAARFGTEEDDEEGTADGESDDEDESGNEDERPRKKPKTAESAPPAPALKKIKEEPVPTERRKRGRPRKSTLPPTPPISAVEQTTYFPVPLPQAQPATALFAVFAFVSFFAPRGDSTSHSHSHSGSVLGATHLDVRSWGWAEIMNALHILAIFIVVISAVLPFAYGWLQKLPRASVKQAAVNKHNDVEESEDEATLVMASSVVSDSSSTETDSAPPSPTAQVVVPPSALEAAAKEMELALGPRAALEEGSRLVLAWLGVHREVADATETQLWVRRGEVLLLLGERAPLAPRIATRFALARRLAGNGWKSARALAVLGLLGADKCAWTRARAEPPRDAYEKAALRLPLNVAIHELESNPSIEDEEDADPINLLGKAWARLEATEKPGATFKRAVLGEREPEPEVHEDAAQLCAELGYSDAYTEGRDLLRAAAKLREVLPQGVATKPVETADVLGLRRMLAADIFEHASPEIEDLRDKVVDRLWRHSRPTAAS